MIYPMATDQYKRTHLLKDGTPLCECTEPVRGTARLYSTPNRFTSHLKETELMCRECSKHLENK